MRRKFVNAVSAAVIFAMVSMSGVPAFAEESAVLFTDVPVEEEASAFVFTDVPMEVTAEAEVTSFETEDVLTEEVEVLVEEVETPAVEADVSVEETKTSETMAEEVETPSEDAETPIEEAETPGTGTETPVEDAEVPAEGTEVPVEDTEVPVEDTEVPVEDVEIPAEDLEISTNEVIVSPEEDAADVTIEDAVIIVGGAGAATLANAGFTVPATEWGFHVEAGDKVEMNVSANVKDGYTVTYQWYQVDDDEKKTLVSGITAGSYKVTVEKDIIYCCVITDNKGNKQEVYFDITVGGNGKDWEVFNGVELEPAVIGSDVVLKPIIDGKEYSELTYQWYGYTDEGGQKLIQGATSYTYTVKNIQDACDYVCIIKDSKGNEDSVTFEIEIKVPTLAKPSVKSVKAKSGKKIQVTWGAVENADGYRIARKVSGGKWERIATVGAEKLSYTDSTPKAGVTYTYTVVAYILANNEIHTSKYESGKSAVAKTAAPKVTVKAKAYNQVKVSWNKVADATGYRVCRKVSGESSWTQIAKVSSSTTSYTDKTVKPGVKYYYTIRGLCKSSANGSELAGSYDSTGASVTTKTAAPEMVSTSSKGYNKIQVTWKTVGGASGYRVCRKVEGGDWKLLKSVSSTTTSYTDTTAVTGVTYYYTVRSVCTANGKTVKGSYDTKGIAGVAKLGKTTVVSAKISSKTKTKITWNTLEGATGYRIFIKQSDGTWKKLATIGSGTASSYTHTKAKGKACTYRVRAYRKIDGKKVWASYSKEITSSK